MLRTGLDFLLSPTFTIRSRVDSKQAVFLQRKVCFSALTSSVCVCLCMFNSDVIKELLETSATCFKDRERESKRLELEDNQWSLFTYFLVKPV